MQRNGNGASSNVLRVPNVTQNDRTFSQVVGGGEMSNSSVENNKYLNQYGNVRIPGCFSQQSMVNHWSGSSRSVARETGNVHVGAEGKVNMCRNGRSCEGIGNGCNFSHDKINKMCKFGTGCNQKERCLFQHGVAEVDHTNSIDEMMKKWLVPTKN